MPGMTINSDLISVAGLFEISRQALACGSKWAPNSEPWASAQRLILLPNRNRSGGKQLTAGWRK